MRRDAVILAVLCLSILVGQVGTGPASAAPRSPQVSCAYDGAERALTVRVRAEPSGLPPELEDEIDLPQSGVAGIGVDGADFDVRNAADRSVACRGGAATVTSVDVIRVVRSGDNDSIGLVLDMRGGPFGPGATDEGGGGSEIEVEADLGGAGSVDARLTNSADQAAVGRLEGSPAANLNPGEAVPDADLVLSSGHVAIDGGGGPDILSGAPALGFDSAPVGPHADGFFLSGGGGADVLLGTDGKDFLDGRGGVDELLGNAGADVIWGLDGARDRIDCGPDHDWAIVDRNDRRHRCEKREFEDPFAGLADFDRPVP